MYGPAASPRLLRLGAEWAAWMFKHAPAHELRAMAGPLLQRLLAALGLQQADGDVDAMQVGGGCDDAIFSNVITVGVSAPCNFACVMLVRLQ
jgi:hypothetical protein